MIERPRLLVVAPSAELYGSDRALLAALPALVEAFAVTVAVPAVGPAVARARGLGAEVVVLPDYALRRRNLRPVGVLPWLARCAVAVARLHRLHRRSAFDLVYSNTLAAALGPVLRGIWRVPHVLHVHECPLRPRWLAPVLLRLARLSSDRVICNSWYTRAFLLRHQPLLEERTVVVHNGLDLAQPGPPSPPSPLEALRVICVGRIHPKKGHAVLIEAARLAAAEGSRWELDLWGDHLPEHEGLRRDLLRQVDAAGLSDRVGWRGFTVDTAAMYAGGDVAVVPSVVPEEFSLVCVEAQAMELAVVATGPGGASEVIVDGETGVIVPPGDAPALAAALRSLEVDPERRRRMGHRGRERMIRHFTREAYATAVRSHCLALVDRTLHAWEVHR